MLKTHVTFTGACGAFTTEVANGPRTGRPRHPIPRTKANMAQGPHTALPRVVPAAAPTPSLQIGVLPWHRGAPASRKLALLLIPALGCLVIMLLWGVIVTRLAVERETVAHDALAEAAILSAALEQHTIKAIRQVDQITRFVKYEYEKAPASFDLTQAVDTGVVPSDTLVEVALIDEHGQLLSSTSSAHPAPLDLSDREHFTVHQRDSKDFLFISKPVLGRVSHHWTLQVTRRLNHPDGSFAGVVVVSEDPAYLTNDFYNDVALGRNGAISVLSDDGSILSRRTGATQISPGNPQQAQRYPDNQRISGSYPDPIDGMSRFVSYRHIDGYPLGVLVGLAEVDEFSDYKHTRDVYLLMAAFITLAMVGFFAVATGLIDKLLMRERDMVELVQTDLLTGLANRYQTLEYLRQEVVRAENVRRLAILFIDLDNFKTVNDTMGHNAGDTVLQIVAERLRAAVGHHSLLARVGGDEFVVVLHSVDTLAEADAAQLAERIHLALRQPCDVRGNVFVLRASIGIALHEEIDDNEIDLLKKADLAMYGAKSAGKNGHQFYSPQLAEHADRLMRMERELRTALAQQQLFLVYQPKIALATRCITGFEALLRWNHPGRGLISAAEFIASAESNGLIGPIGDFVLEQACAQLRLWQQAGYRDLTMAINISPVQFWRGDIVATVSRCIRDYKVPPHLIELEITETAMMEHAELVAQRISALKQLGVRIALDDFGTGYSSLSFLKRFAVDTLKVDKSFVQAIPHDVQASSMVAGVIRLAQSLGLTVVVEGTEREEQVEWLAVLGNIEVQGYLYSRPVPSAEVVKLIERYGICRARAPHPALVAPAPTQA
jgi:diguanylate cyclase (GGDEF)-like protein